MASVCTGITSVPRSAITGSPTGGWKEVETNYPDLFPNAEELEAAWYRKTGIYPMHGVLTIKDEIIKNVKFEKYKDVRNYYRMNLFISSYYHFLTTGKPENALP